MQKLSINITDEKETENLAVSIAPLIKAPLWMSLSGNLGSGKTTFTRYLLHSMGHSGAVKSPTYSLVECYDLPGKSFYHMDLYRLSDPEELEYLGIRDYQHQQTIALVEWPEKGQGFLPGFDINLTITMEQGERTFEFTALTANGESLLQAIE